MATASGSPGAGRDAEAHIERARRSLTAAYWREYPLLMASCWRLLGSTSAASAEDVAQDVFVRLWQDPLRYDPDKAPLASFLVLHMRNRAVDVVRAETAREHRQERTRGREGHQDVEETALARRRAQAVQDALQGLNVEHRQVIDLTFFAGHSYRRAALILGLPEGTVKSRIRTALLHLRAALRAVEDEYP